MKYLIYTLLLLNLMVFLWEKMSPATEVEERLPPQRQADKLLLLSELPSPPRSAPPPNGGRQPTGGGNADRAPASEPPRRDSAPEMPEPTCFTLGPFEEEQLPAARRSLRSQAEKFRERQIHEREQYGYQVFIPPRESLAAARRSAAELRVKGIKDYFIMTGDENRNGISLGLFREKRYAVRHLESVQSLGFDEATLEPRYRDRLRIWLDFRDDEGRVDDQLIRELSRERPLQRLSHDCRGLL